MTPAKKHSNNMMLVIKALLIISPPPPRNTTRWGKNPIKRLDGWEKNASTDSASARPTPRSRIPIAQYYNALKQADGDGGYPITSALPPSRHPQPSPSSDSTAYTCLICPSLQALDPEFYRRAQETASVAYRSAYQAHRLQAVDARCCIYPALHSPSAPAIYPANYPSNPLAI